jgi:aminoglycoside phosphotransferase (APT) family kinase protein
VSANPASPELAPEWQRAFAWIERELGGKVVRAERQPRWRPAWFLDVEREGQRLPLYFRGDRGAMDHGVYPLEHEMRILQVLEAHGIPVPHVYGFCPDPRGIVMQRVPGRPNLATAETDAERRTVLDHYIDLLARMHRIDVSAFEAIGLQRPTTPEQLGLGDFDSWERAYRRFKRRPDPMIEFAIGWLRRNVPRDRSRVAFLTCDAGQFLFDRGRVTCVLDLELAYLGDPAADFAGMRCRHLSEPLGDLARARRRYEELTGEPLDPRAIDYHTVRFGMCTPMSVAHVIAAPPPDVDLVQYLGWYAVYARIPLEVLAQLVGASLEPPERPALAPTRQSVDHAALVEMVRAIEPGEPFEVYRRDVALRVARYLERAEALGPALWAQDLEEMSALLGYRPSSWEQGDADLERLVASCGAERDVELVRYFWRRVLRLEWLLEPELREMVGARVAPIE